VSAWGCRADLSDPIAAALAQAAESHGDRLDLEALIVFAGPFGEPAARIAAGSLAVLGLCGMAGLFAKRMRPALYALLACVAAHAADQAADFSQRIRASLP
jgi:hypothetical protein